MVFNSAAFLLFFPIVTLGFFTLPVRLRWWWLLAASVFFYAWFIPIYLLILGGTIVVDYFAGLLIGGARTQAARRMWLGVSLAGNVGVLAVFKYWNFLCGNVNPGLAALSVPGLPLLEIALPIGLSFHTFQALSYIIEVYRGRQPPERHFGLYALYVMFYPQLVAGPIERPQNVLPQFHLPPAAWDADRFISGVRLMLWGLFKKVVIADNLAVIVSAAYDQPKTPGWMLWLATYAFCIQIYGDFSGYSDIARGAARCMGITLMENFRAPYMARSIAEFWSRWHISLSTWFRDYVYIPLGGSRVSEPKIARNITIVFLLSGLWHGADWKFVIWGALHAVFFLVARLTANWRQRHWLCQQLARPAIEVFVTFHLVAISWVFFRASSAARALEILQRMGLALLQPIEALASGPPMIGLLSLGDVGVRLMLASIVGMFGIEAMRHSERGMDSRWRASWTSMALLMAILLVGNSGAKVPFIYFQF